MKVYIAGPMTGLPGYNGPAFEAAIIRLHELGHEPVSPTRIHGYPWPQCCEGKSRGEIMRTCLAALVECDGIALLPGWQDHDGAQAEAHAANAMGLEVVAV